MIVTEINIELLPEQDTNSEPSTGEYHLSWTYVVPTKNHEQGIWYRPKW